MAVFLVVFVLILSEVINRVYSTLIGVALVLFLLSLIYHKQHLPHVMHRACAPGSNSLGPHDA